MATATKTLYTAEEFLELDLPDGLHELVKGEVIEEPMPMPEHGRLCLNSGFLFESFGRRTGLGYALSNDSAVLTERGPDTVRGADVCFYRNERWPREKVGNGLIPVPPDVVVEVVSPSNRPGEMRKKVNEYLDIGVAMVWAVYPQKRLVVIHRPDEDFPALFREGEAIEGLAELPGFRCDVSEFFQ